MSARQTSLEKVTRFRLRQRGLLPDLPDCPLCGRRVRSGRYGGICSRCWKRTPEGKAADAARKRRARQSAAPNP